MPRLQFDFPPTVQTGPTVYTDPVGVVRADTLDTVTAALETVREAVRDGLHAAGFLAYEAAPAFDPAMQVRGQGDLPLLWFGLFRGATGSASAGRHGGRDREADESPTPLVADWELEMSRAAHAAAVRRIHDAIAEGRTYQVNLTTRLRGRFEGEPEALYQRLRRAQGPGYHALLDLGAHAIVSASPELFFRTRGRTITTRPMKGTRPRGRWPEEDRRLADELAASPKDRAENLMIVDLLRNDLGRICVPGGVHVPALWEVERYRTVWQMTSSVTGRLRDDVGLVELFRALFPCGSVTGAPKISTMEVIAGLERSPRDVYCGAIGWIRPGGDCMFSVPIRTAWIDREAGRVTYGTGGGVVWDSTPQAEYDELVAKAAVARSSWPRFRLLETLALHHGRAVRLDRHLQRMAASAERFDMPFPGATIRQAVDRAARTHPDGRARLRITLGPDGDVVVESGPLGPVGAGVPAGAAPAGAGCGPARGSATDATSVARRRAVEPEPRVVALGASPVDSGNLFLYHKTTHRAIYDRQLAAAPDAFDVLLWNERAEVTEFCRGNVVVELDGRLLTPPRDAGLLVGCLRGELIEAGRITEATVTLDDLDRAARLWFINSARGWIPVRLRPPARAGTDLPGTSDDERLAGDGGS